MAETKIHGLLDRNVGAETRSVMTTYEKHIARLEREKAVLVKKALKVAHPNQAREKSVRTFCDELSSYWDMSENSGPEVRKSVLGLVFLVQFPIVAEKGGLVPKSFLYSRC